MNEALVDACLKVARLTRALAEARAEMEAAREPESAVRATKMGSTQLKTAPGRALSKLADPGASPTEKESTGV